ncbi:glycosyltransferase family 2 protein [Frondihabitans cladoniiphilus]|uniref:4,4'-diaponeurosporenoate glycosyltransferase n=1 Tax=Frondihabitans cladoniiphilus TaxID=715785 RepID=A0ABP8VKV7_9MICO
MSDAPSGSASSGSAPAGDGPVSALVVVVPARNEEGLIGRCLVAMAAAVRRLEVEHPRVAVRFVVVADACTDSTVDLCRDVAGLDLVVSGLGRVGAARALGVSHGLQALGTIEPDRVWIANTDADSAVPSNWLTVQVALAAQGADGMIGTVRPDPADLSVEEDERWLATHERGRPNGHVHGANLGVRASAYLNAGGFDAVPEHEDNRLVDRLRAEGAVLVASDEAEVLTSGRRVGRTPGGYAEYLAVNL